jgi:hypothetical protein
LKTVEGDQWGHIATVHSHRQHDFDIPEPHTDHAQVVYDIMSLPAYGSDFRLQYNLAERSTHRIDGYKVKVTFLSIAEHDWQHMMQSVHSHYGIPTFVSEDH